MKSFLQEWIYKLIEPLVKLLIALNVSPNMITTMGFLINIVAAAVLIYGADHGTKGDLSTLGWGGGLILFAGFFDILDGRLARRGKMSSKFGALYDSTLDRYSELIMFLGICYFLISRHYFISSLWGFIALIGSMMVSYVRARAEGLGIECKGGLMQRPERVVTIGVSALLCGIVSHMTGGNQELIIDRIPFKFAETISIFIYPLVAVAILSNLTAIRRLRDCKHEFEKGNRDL
ncbi:MAG TPA: CDP-alcohol phosphatidyltransferase family protein [Bacteroidales bacterium]|nr:CDP-alcohol phosphatidyltransferase family protein [Bacteroidales bacterium]HRZ20025.1 CDP-alcohol phosphatidyltransferase family protein [Bacteroidales bacterium]